MVRTALRFSGKPAWTQPLSESLLKAALLSHRIKTLIDFYYAPTPNGWKVAIMLEECGLPYKTHLMNLAGGDQFEPDFLAISPNAKMPRHRGSR